MEAAADIVFQVAEGLDYAHSKGLIHRDIKPANVLVTPEGEAKLSDLGLAGPLEDAAENDPRYGKIVGTADYLSPDHIKSPWEPTPAWDIYSLGCTLYYAVTGKVPFPGGTTSEKAFVDRMADMMAKSPSERTASAAEVMSRLTPWTHRRPPAAIPSPAATGPPPVPPPVGPRPISLPPPVILDEPDDEDSSSQILQTTDPRLAARRKLVMQLLLFVVGPLALLGVGVLLWALL